MKKKIAIAVATLAILSIAMSLFGYYWYRSTQVDTSWVENIDKMLGDFRINPNSTELTNPDILASYCRVYLYENGTSDLVEFGNLNSNQTLSIYLNNLLTKVNIQLKSISKESLDNILVNDKVIEIVYRESTQQLGRQQRFSTGYFILKDTQNQGLIGTIITQQIGSSSYHSWEIVN